MQIILLSGGSGKRLWPLSNGIRSKQFLKLFEAPDGTMESMVQRVLRQIKSSGLDAEVVVATSAAQTDSIQSQLGNSVSIVAEPSRRDTFPAIALSCSYLCLNKKLPDDEVVIVMPSDPFTEEGYFHAIKRMAAAVSDGVANLILLGIVPESPSSKFGYIVPDKINKNLATCFVEKPIRSKAEVLIKNGGLWNGGVFAFRLGYLKNIIQKYFLASSFKDILSHYDTLPKISFDYEVVEKENSIGIVRFNGKWKDLGTWDAIADELNSKNIGNVIGLQNNDSLIINELSIPIICNGINNSIVVASPDGILVADKNAVDNIKPLVEKVENPPMCEERRWGRYTIIGFSELKNGVSVLTKEIIINPGCSISYHCHTNRDEIWNIVDGEGEYIIDGVCKAVNSGEVVIIKRNQLHSIKAKTQLTIIEIEKGYMLLEDDFERFPFPD